MASPQTDEGFVMLALDLFVALLTADLKNGEAIVLAEVLLQSYGPAKRRDVVIDPPSLEELTGLHRNNVRRALAGLVAARILARNPDGTYRFLKDWEQYTPGGKPYTERLGGRLAVAARNALARFGTRRHPSRKATIQRDCVSGKNAIQRDCLPAGSAIPLDCDQAPERNPVGLRSGAEPQSNGIADVPINLSGNSSTPTGSDSSLACAGAPAEFKNLDKTRQTDKTEFSPSVSVGSVQETVELALDLFGAAAAEMVHRNQLDIGSRIEGLDGRPRWDCFMAALRAADFNRKRPGARPIGDLQAYCLPIAQEYVLLGVPAGPVSAPGAPHVPFSRRECRDSEPVPPAVVLSESSLRRYRSHTPMDKDPARVPDGTPRYDGFNGFLRSLGHRPRGEGGGQ